MTIGQSKYIVADQDTDNNLKILKKDLTLLEAQNFIENRSGKEGLMILEDFNQIKPVI